MGDAHENGKGGNPRKGSPVDETRKGIATGVATGVASYQADYSLGYLVPYIPATASKAMLFFVVFLFRLYFTLVLIPVI